MRIAEHILDSKATAIVVVNKWDLSREDKDKVSFIIFIFLILMLKLMVVMMVAMGSGRSTCRIRSSS